jgi:membrane peptidoglycan carboxypeptidase
VKLLGISGRSESGEYEEERKDQAPAGRRINYRLILRLLKIGVVIVAAGALAFAVLLTVTPSVDNAQALVQVQASEHGATYPGPEVPPRFAAALVATEDHRFYSEPGIDLLALPRVVFAGITGNTDQGGSTIEQQLAKMLYTPNRSGFWAKVEQVALGVKLNFGYSKSQILQMYAEVAYYGNQYYGLQKASCGYFGRPGAQLSWVQSAMLAGVVNAPTDDDPVTHPAQAHIRLTHVVGRLVAVGTFTQAQASAVLGQSLQLVPRSEAGCRLPS